MQSAKDHKLDDRSKEKVKDKGKEKDKDKEKAKVKGKGSSLFPILGGSFMSSKNVLAESKSSTAENSLEADNQGKEKSNSHEGISRHVHRFAKAPSSSTAAAKETVWFFTPFDSPLPIPVSAASNATAPLSSSIASSTSSPQSIQSHRSVAMDIPSLCEGSQGNSYSANTISSAMHSDVMRVSTPSSSLVSQVSIHSAHSHASDFHTNGSINTSSIHSTPSRKHENSKSKKNYVGFRLGRSVSNADSITPHEPVVALYSTSQSATDHIIIPEKPHHMMLAEQIDMSYARQDNMMFQPSAFKDEYGFPIDEDCVDLQAKYYEQVQQRTQKRRMGWYTYLRGIGLNGKKLEKNSHLVSMVRGGIPPELRGQVWQILTNVREYRDAIELSYAEMTAKMMDDLNSQDPEEAYQIDKDLCRTFPGHDVINSPELLASLRRILILYAHFNPAVGYCQSMNFLAATFLLFMCEEDAFWMLCHTIDNVIPRDYYSSNLFGITVDHRVFVHLIKEKLPRLHAHFDYHGITLESVAFQWLLCLFVTAIPFESSMRVWDSLMCEGNKVLFRVALSMLKNMEKSLLELDSMADIMVALKEYPRKMYDGDVIMKGGWDRLWIGSFPRTHINQLRLYYSSIVQDEFEAMTKLMEDSEENENESSHSTSDQVLEKSVPTGKSSNVEVNSPTKTTPALSGTYQDSQLNLAIQYSAMELQHEDVAKSDRSERNVGMSGDSQAMGTIVRHPHDTMTRSGSSRSTASLSSTLTLGTIDGKSSIRRRHERPFRFSIDATGQKATDSRRGSVLPSLALLLESKGISNPSVDLSLDPRPASLAKQGSQGSDSIRARNTSRSGDLIFNLPRVASWETDSEEDQDLGATFEKGVFDESEEESDHESRPTQQHLNLSPMAKVTCALPLDSGSSSGSSMLSRKDSMDSVGLRQQEGPSKRDSQKRRAMSLTDSTPPNPTSMVTESRPAPQDTIRARHKATFS